MCGVCAQSNKVCAVKPCKESAVVLLMCTLSAKRIHQTSQVICVLAKKTTRIMGSNASPMLNTSRRFLPKEK